MKTGFLVWMLAGWAAMTCSQAWALNKCVSTSGKISYQEQPCAAEERPAMVPLPPTQAEIDRRASEKATRAAVARQKAVEFDQAAKKARDERQARESAAQLRQETDKKWARAEAACGKAISLAPTVGMLESDFLRCTAVGLFASYSVSSTETANGVTKQYVFTNDIGSHGVRYAYTRNGVVSAVQR